MKTKPKSKVTRLTLARLYSTGNYEHIRFEITAEVPGGGSAKQTLMDMGVILGKLKPILKPFGYDHAKEVLMKLPESRSETEKDQLERFREIVGNYERAKALRMEALQALDSLGGTSKSGGGFDRGDDDELF